MKKVVLAKALTRDTLARMVADETSLFSRGSFDDRVYVLFGDRLKEDANLISKVLTANKCEVDQDARTSFMVPRIVKHKVSLKSTIQQIHISI